MTARKAIGIVRVSVVGDRDDEDKKDSFVSPEIQRARIKDACGDDLRLIQTFEEMDVSGGLRCPQRPKMLAAVEAIEAGQAEVLVVAYRDRLDRSIVNGDEIVSRVERAGGAVLAVDGGEVSHRTTTQWANATMGSFMGEFQRRMIREKTMAAVAKRVEAGIAPWPNIAPGYVRGEDGKLVPDPETKDAVVEAFRLRASGASWREVREHLRAHGIARSHQTVGALLRSRVVRGEIHFGDLHNLDAHDPIVDEDLWKAAQHAYVPRGPKRKSDRLLARLGVLRCATCGGRMVVGVQIHRGRRYPLYRCATSSDCTQKVSISAPAVEKIVTDAVRERLADEKGRASADTAAREAEQRLDRAQADLDAALRAFEGFDEAAARERLTELREVRDQAQDEVDQIGGVEAVETVDVGRWDDLTLDEKRDLIRATVERVEVRPGRGSDRVQVTMRGENRANERSS